MKLELILVLGAVAATSSLFPPAVNADTYSSVTTTEQSMPLTETRTIESAPLTTVIREQPVIINQPANREVVIVKRHRHHHLIIF